MSTKFYLQTRGKTIDYRFLYESPRSGEWWRDYAEHTLFEDRTIILEQLNDEKGRLYLSGIPSHKRRDRVNTVIRYTLVAEFNKGEGSELLPLVIRFLDDCYKNSNTLGDKLDDLFSEQDVEDALRCPDRSEKKNEKHKYMGNKIKDNLDLFNSSDIEDDNQNVDDLKDIYWGGLKFKHSRSHWRSLVKQILKNGESGIAALLNAASEKSLPFLKEKLRRVDNAFILLSDDDSKPKPIENPRKDNMEIFQGAGVDIKKRVPENLRNIFPLFSPRIYLGAGVLFSAFIFLIFIIVR